jgi:predicted MFS family arabinose efflux permease
MGQALGGFGATIAATFSWHATFHTFGLIGMAYALVLVAFLREKKGARGADASDRILTQEKPPLFKGLAVLFR